MLWRRLPGVLASTPIAAGDLARLGDLLAELDESCLRYDAGDERACRPLAAAVVVLVHDSALSTSLLVRLGLEDALPWADGTLVAEPMWVREQASTGAIPIVSMLTAPRSTVSARGEEPGGERLAPAYTAEALGARWVPFAAWWESPRIYGFPDIALARRDLVLQAAHEGVAGSADPAHHVDDQPPAPRTTHRFGDFDGVFVELAVRGAIGDSPVPAAIRQIAEEVRFTLRATLRETLAEAREARQAAPPEAFGERTEAAATRHPLSAPRP